MHPVEHSSASLPSATPSRSAGPATRVAAGRVLVIDDHPQLRTMLRTALETADFEVAAVNSLARASAWLERAWPAVIVLDFQRAGSHGLHAVRALRARSVLDHVPLVFLAPDLGDGLRWRAVQAGADYVLPKPLSLIELQERVSRLVRTGRPRLRLVAGRTRAAHRLAG